IDDFAHHPTAVKETLEALKNSYADQRLIAVFEPRTNTSRRTIFQQQYASAFDFADHVMIREPVPLANVSSEELFSAEKLMMDLKERNVSAQSYSDTDNILEALKDKLQENDVVVILSNGSFDNIHNRLLEQLKRLHPRHETFTCSNSFKTARRK
ncbi:MAG TPA: hypothetical protein EYH10_01980, partial [Deltaproteobacteria bacterium]|nr:hypothetical protein [Deltaproteobacteria bacterium]